MNGFEENLKDVLTKYGRDITEDAKAGKIDPVIGRDEEIRNITRILSRKTKNNPVLVGAPGVGKTAVAEGLAIRIVNNENSRRPRRRFPAFIILFFLSQIYILF